MVVFQPHNKQPVVPYNRGPNILKNCFNIKFSVSIVYLNWYGVQQQGLKSSMLSIILTMQVLTEKDMHTSQGEVPISGVGAN